MDRLGQVVLVAGKNGCGKTRLLNLVKNMVHITQQLIQNKSQYSASKAGLQKNIIDFNQNISSYEHQLLSIQDEGTRGNYRNTISQWQKNIENFEQQIDQLEQQWATPNPLEFAEGVMTMNTVDFIPKKVKLDDYLRKPSHDWKNLAEKIVNVGVDHLDSGTFPLLQLTQNRALFSALPTSTATQEEKDRFAAEFNRLDELIFSFLGCHLGHDNEGNSTIFGYQLGSSMLSDGQSIIIQLCAAIFCQGGSLNNFTIFMDEPENHLHPSAVIDLLDKIRELHPNGQFWIATHSIPLLSHFDPSSIWYVEEGLVRHAGRTPEKVLRSLLGDEERIQKLREFTSLPAELATNRFAFECLLPPDVVLTDKEDPQTKQLQISINALRQEKKFLRLLDFGAGKGRMIANLADQEPDIATTLDYYAYDEWDNNKDICINNIKASYPGDADARYHNSIESLRCKCDDNSFDVVVLCNVLHEIPTDEWIGLINRIYQLLTKDGFLLLVEDCRIPTGELPHKNGFVVLNTLHLKKLFRIGESEAKFVAHDARLNDPSQRNRLMAHLIPAPYLQNVTAESLRSALEELKDSAITSLKELRLQKPSYLNGLAHSFWSQQLANSVISLR
jgi:ABC-type cobalamin/Fe3+-siderophores transport system ATPase subunit/SAM-dependent methyltransferase